MKKKIAAYILSGGSSSRIGTDKAFLKLGEKKIIEIIIDNLKDVFFDIKIVSNNPEKYSFLNLVVIDDIYKNYGPLAGIHSALNDTSAKRNFIISCDMPFVTKNLLKFIAEYKSSKDIILPQNGKVQTLCGIYSKKCKTKAEKILKDSTVRNYSIHRLLDICKPELIDVKTEYEQYNSSLFFNINTKEEYSEIKNLYL